MEIKYEIRFTPFTAHIKCRASTATADVYVAGREFVSRKFVLCDYLGFFLSAVELRLRIRFIPFCNFQPKRFVAQMEFVELLHTYGICNRII